MATHSSILAWKIPWTAKPGWLQSMECKKSDTDEHTRKPNMLSCSIRQYLIHKQFPLPAIFFSLLYMANPPSRCKSRATAPIFQRQGREAFLGLFAALHCTHLHHYASHMLGSSVSVPVFPTRPWHLKSRASVFFISISLKRQYKLVVQ